MKNRILLLLSLMCLVISGCGQPADTPADGGADAPPSDEQSATVATEDESPLAAGDSSADPISSDMEPMPTIDDSHAPVDASVDGDPISENGDVASDDPQGAMEEFNRKLGQALQIQDYDLALALIDAQIEAFPDDLSLKVNQLAIRVGSESRLEASDEAAQRFLQTAELASELEEIRSQLPPQIGQVFMGAQMNEARAYAHQENVPKATELVVGLVKGGLGDLTQLMEDPFFAKIRDNESFRSTLDGIWTTIAREEIADFDSFPFDFELPSVGQEKSADDESSPELIRLSELKGKLVIVDIWGTWCPPCRQEIPHFVKLQETFADDLDIIGVNYENGEGEEILAKIRDFAAEQSMNYTCVIGDEATRSQIPNFEGFPTTLFLDRTGKVRLKVVGYHSYEKLEAYVQTLLEESAAG